MSYGEFYIRAYIEMIKEERGVKIDIHK